MLFFKFTKWKDGTERYMSYRTNLIKYEHHFYPKYLQISGLPKRSASLLLFRHFKAYHVFIKQRIPRNALKNCQFSLVKSNN